MNDHIITLAKSIWDYLHMPQSLEKADCVIALGSNDLRVADHAADLVFQKFAPLLVCSGGIGRLALPEWQKPEAEVFADRAMKRGIPQASILVENRPANAGKNISYTKQLLEELGIPIQRAILVTQPPLERRVYAVV